LGWATCVDRYIGRPGCQCEQSLLAAQTRENPRARLAFATDLIRQKAESTLVTLDEYLPRSAL